MQQADETVLITGASSGIGRELAKCFARDRFGLILVARNRERLEELAEQLRKDHGSTVKVVTADLSQADAPQRLFEGLSQEGIEVDVIVNNAGFGAGGAVADLEVERQLSMIRVNVSTLTHLTRLFLPGMIRRGRGGVLNIGSTAAFQAGPNMAVYYATKAYVLSFSEALTEELRKTGVRVSCLNPGPTSTGFASEAGMEGSLLFRMGTMTAEQVARVGYKGFCAGKAIVVPGWKNKLGVACVHLLPRAVTRKVARFLQT